MNKQHEGSLVLLYSIGFLYGCLSVRDFYISYLSFDAKNKKMVHGIDEYFTKNLADQIF